MSPRPDNIAGAVLERLGVARVSVGGGPARAALTAVRRVARELLERGSYESFTNDMISHPEMNAMMTRGRGPAH